MRYIGGGARPEAHNVIILYMVWLWKMKEKKRKQTYFCFILFHFLSLFFLYQFFLLLDNIHPPFVINGLSWCWGHHNFCFINLNNVNGKNTFSHLLAAKCKQICTCICKHIPHSFSLPPLFLSLNPPSPPPSSLTPSLPLNPPPSPSLLIPLPPPCNPPSLPPPS